MKKIFSTLLILSFVIIASQSHATTYCYTNGPVLNGDGYYKVTISIIDNGQYNNYVPYVVYTINGTLYTVPLAGSMFLVANGGMGSNPYAPVVIVGIQWYQPSFTGGSPTPMGSPFAIPQC